MTLVNKHGTTDNISLTKITSLRGALMGEKKGSDGRE